MYAPKCNDCGRYMRITSGTAWMMVYTCSAIPDPQEQIFRCAKCVEVKGYFTHDPRIKPEFSCGVVA